MLMNGKEVNHLVINGEAFDKSFENGRKVRTVRNARIGEIDESGMIHNQPGTSGWYIEKNIVFSVIARYKNAFCVAYGYGNYAAWVSIDDVELIDEKVMGGVNSPSYLLFIFYCISLLALGVLLPC